MDSARVLSEHAVQLPGRDVVDAYSPVRARRRDVILGRHAAPLDMELRQPLGLARISERVDLGEFRVADAQDVQDLLAGDHDTIAVGVRIERHDLRLQLVFHVARVEVVRPASTRVRWPRHAVGSGGQGVKAAYGALVTLPGPLLPPIGGPFPEELGGRLALPMKGLARRAKTALRGAGCGVEDDGFWSSELG